MKRSNSPGKKVVAFCGSEKAEENLRFSTCFEKVIPFEFWVSLEKKENPCEKFTHLLLKRRVEIRDIFNLKKCLDDGNLHDFAFFFSDSW
jgi:hypothetical protein